MRKLSPVESHKVITKLLQDFGESKALDKNAEKIARAYSQELGFPIKGCSIRYLADQLEIERPRIQRAGEIPSQEAELGELVQSLLERVERLEKRVEGLRMVVPGPLSLLK